MKKLNNLHFVISILLILGFTSCRSHKEIKDEFDPLILNCWKHSYEEEVDNKIYRPCDYKEFRISRYRNSFTLEKDGKATYLVLSPNDAHYMEEGKWAYTKNTNSLIIKNNRGIQKMNFEIISLSKTKLILKEK